VIRCHCCEEKLAKEKNDRAHARNAVEQLIHTQIQRGYNLNVPVNRTFTNLRFVVKKNICMINQFFIFNQSTKSSNDLIQRTFSFSSHSSVTVAS